MDAALLGRSRRDVTVVELSHTGCLVLCESALDRGAILDLEVEVDHEPLAAKVRVSQTSLEGGQPPGQAPRYLTGLEFLALPARDEARLRRFLEQRRKRNVDAPPE
jgi:c-di-GMP-binding flagellar brake protein YcgR